MYCFKGFFLYVVFEVFWNNCMRNNSFDIEYILEGMEKKMDWFFVEEVVLMI